jgi:hypothetical protein
MDTGKLFHSPWGNVLGLGDFTTVVLQNAVIFVGIIMFILMLVGGVMAVVGAGNDNPDQASKGKTVLTSALIGFIIVFAAYWIMLIIEYITGVSILNSTL